MTLATLLGYQSGQLMERERGGTMGWFYATEKGEMYNSCLLSN